MKKAISLMLAVMMLLMCGITAFATEATTETVTVYISLADSEGKLALTQEAITVTDIDSDGVLTVHDALYAAHEAKFEGGAAAGYGAEESQYGLGITKLWGVENGGSYGYYVNNASAWSLTDPVKNGDYINAFIYTDLVAWSDTYCYFDVNTATVDEGAALELTLSAAGYDAEYNPITVPVEGATITVNGTATDVKTDAEGKASLKLDVAGKVVISATSETQTLVPPVCVATVSQKQLILSGSGTESDPYLLQNAADFDHLDELVSGGQRFDGVYFKVTADITLNEGWNGIGYAEVEMKESWGSIIPTTNAFVPFAGHFDGNGHTLTFPAGSQPLFDCVSNATVCDLKIKSEYIAASGLIAHYAVENGPDGSSGTEDDWTAIIENITILSGTKIAGSGLLGGYARGTNTVTVKNCTIEAGVTVGCDENGNSLNASNIGGIAGDFNGTVENCSCAATVYGKDFVGGIIGGKGQSMGACSVSNTTFSGTVIATGNYAGGIAGSGYTGTGWGFTNNAGGVTVTDCTVTGSVTGGDYVGGIFGADPGVVQYWDNAKGQITNNKFLGTITSEGKFVGAIIGYMKSLNANFTISGNSYKGDYAPIGGIEYVDTSCENPTAVEGTTYINTANGKPDITGMSKTDQNRTDDPLGADLEALAVRITEDEPIPPTGDPAYFVVALTVMAAMGIGAVLASKKRYV